MLLVVTMHYGQNESNVFLDQWLHVFPLTLEASSLVQYGNVPVNLSKKNQHCKIYQ